jgi:hypothetical protein
MVFELNRRDFIKVSVASVTALRELRLDRTLSDHERATLREVAQTMFPHAGATREFYQQAVDHIEEVCHRNHTLFAVIARGISSLERACGGQFAAGSETDRIRVLKKLEISPFFHLVYGCCLESLYRSQMIWDILAASSGLAWE